MKTDGFTFSVRVGGSACFSRCNNIMGFNNRIHIHKRPKHSRSDLSAETGSMETNLIKTDQPLEVQARAVVNEDVPCKRKREGRVSGFAYGAIGKP